MNRENKKKYMKKATIKTTHAMTPLSVRSADERLCPMVREAGTAIIVRPVCTASTWIMNRETARQTAAEAWSLSLSG